MDLKKQRKKKRWIKVYIKIKNYYIKHTLFFNWLDRIYDGTLRYFHLRMTFYDEILNSFKENKRWKSEFIKNLSELNSFIKSKGLPPVIGMVLTVSPDSTRGRILRKIAEEYFLKTGYIVQSSFPYYEEAIKNKIQLHVSAWDGHPNEYCNRIFAKALYDAIVNNSVISQSMDKYKK